MYFAKKEIPKEILDVSVSFITEKITGNLCPLNKTGVWRISFNGDFVTLTSGKHTWKQVGHAKSAFSNYLSSSDFIESDFWSKFVNIGFGGKAEIFMKVIEELSERRILEFVQIA